ncbi:glutamine synthetase family protein [Lacticaseibacillus thailandensis]|nr:glutamine synthetase family protein [Lacticaseibacillus thailandensis]
MASTYLPEENRAQNIVNGLREKGVQLVEFIYVDYNGVARGKTVTIDSLSRHIVDGVGLTLVQFAATARDEIVDVPGLTAVGESRLVPDLDSMHILPNHPQVATFMCDHLTQDQQPFTADPRGLLQRVIADAAQDGFTAQATYENEFMLRNAETDAPANDNFCFDTDAMEFAYDFISEMIDQLKQMGIGIDKYYPEAGTGQHELPMRPYPLLQAADNEIWFKREVRAVARKHGMRATFAPKPDMQTEGNGGHLHLSLWDQAGHNVLADAQDPVGLSQQGYYFVGGILAHIRGLLALTAATVNSYQRLQPGEWSSAYAAYGKDNREAAVRIPSTQWDHVAATANIELKASDATANPYLALAGLLSAGLDGIRNHIDPGAPVNVDPATLTDAEREAAGIQRLPLTLDEALQALNADALFKDLMGEQMLTGYTAVKQADINHFAHYDDQAIGTETAHLY